MKLISYNYTEQRLNVCYDDKRIYSYTVPEYWYRRLQGWMAKKNRSAVARYLRRL